MVGWCPWIWWSFYRQRIDSGEGVFSKSVMAHDCRPARIAKVCVQSCSHSARSALHCILLSLIALQCCYKRTVAFALLPLPTHCHGRSFSTGTTAAVGAGRLLSAAHSCMLAAHTAHANPLPVVSAVHCSKCRVHCGICPAIPACALLKLPVQSRYYCFIAS